MNAADFEALGWPYPQKCAATFAELVVKFADAGAPRFDAFAETRAQASRSIRPERGAPIPPRIAAQLRAIDRAKNPYAHEEVARAHAAGLIEIATRTERAAA